LHFAASLRTLKVSTATSKNEIATMNQHPDTKIPTSLLRTIGAWMVQVVNKHKISDRALDEEEAAPLLRGLLGDGVTLGIFRGLDGGAVLNELRDEFKIKLPRNMEAVFAGFVRVWSPNTPICPACKVPSIRPLADRTGVEILPEGSVCPWCAKETVRLEEFSGSLRSWVTGANLPLDTEFDDITVRGTRLPLQEKTLRDQTRADLLTSLDRQDVLVHDWLRYLLVSGHQVFGLPRAHLPILASLDNDAVMQYGTLIVDAQILAAKRTTERVAAGHALETHYRARILTTPDDGTPSEQEVYALLSKLSPTQFEQFLFYAHVPVEHISSSNAPMLLRVCDVLGLVRSGALRLSDIYNVALRVRGC
jgi:hypothetical protein